MFCKELAFTIALFCCLDKTVYPRFSRHHHAGRWCTFVSQPVAVRPGRGQLVQACNYWRRRVTINARIEQYHPKGM